QADEWPSEDVEREMVFHDEANDPQYLAASTQDAMQIGRGKIFSAWRSLGKVYVGNFYGENSGDIVLWRKLYESRLNSDSVKGFIKKGDLLVHYKLINGEYKKQSTDQSAIKSWLTAKQLTWSKGYPNKSECAGQEGQLIPEMHDPQLNDPDVMQ
ncbi:MAG TPA: hypothetical protein PK031_05900, partial [Pseudomonadales bacterium]|nr:hypothetical protein [Pseudomonadales bacterium]